MVKSWELAPTMRLVVPRNSDKYPGYLQDFNLQDQGLT